MRSPDMTDRLWPKYCDLDPTPHGIAKQMHSMGQL